jgi:putative ubiquitin-RnfH superfamily antitoxin RatB of RatAB toxin-antitoxin module
VSAEDAIAIAVEFAWSPAPREMRTATLRLPRGATIAAALRATGWAEVAQALASDAALAAAGLSVAVWSHGRPLATELRDGDRIELLRALTIAPMDARRARYEAAGGVEALRRRKHAAQSKR